MGLFAFIKEAGEKLFGTGEAKKGDTFEIRFALRNLGFR